jgi:hypothetical protein
MRLVLATLAATLAATSAWSETITTIKAAPGQEGLVMGRYQSPLPGAKPINVTVGIGSSAFHDPQSSQEVYYTLGDRGPNFTCDEAAGPLGLSAEAACPAVGGLKAGTGRVYPRPDYNIAIYEVKLDRDAKTYQVTKTIGLKTPKGTPISGMTNPLTVATTETPRDGAGQPLKQDANSIDAEAIVRLADGRFFVAEENATGLVEISPEGVIVRRFVPAGTEKDFAAAEYPVSGSLPAILAKRHSNRGLESLAISEDGRFLYSLVQNPLDNPDGKAYNNAVNTRLLKLEIGKGADGATTLTPVGEYVYQLDDWKAFKTLGATDAEKPSSLRISEMLGLGHEHFLVDERTDQIAKLFEISLDGATNILGSKWDDPATKPTLEQSHDLAALDVNPVTKTERLVASSLESANPRYPAKLEGVALTPDGKLFLINDNDFGIGGDETDITIVDGTGVGRR